MNSTNLRGVAVILLVAGFLGSAADALAQTSGTWKASPGSGDFNTAANWVGGAVPGAGGTATFDATDTSTLYFSASISLGSLVLGVSAPVMTFSVTNGAVTLALTGAGVVNTAAVAPTFAVGGGLLELSGTAALGNAVVAVANYGAVYFYDQASAEDATITGEVASDIGFFGHATLGRASLTLNTDPTDSEEGGYAEAADHASLGTGQITVNVGAQLEIYGEATAEGATITNRGEVRFEEQSTAGHATITNHGQLAFEDDASADNAFIGGDGEIVFKDNTTAGFASISLAAGGTLTFYDSANAGYASIVSGGLITFDTGTTATQATIFTQAGGVTQFLNGATAGAAILHVQAGGLLEFRGASQPGQATVDVGSGGAVHFFNNPSDSTASFTVAAGGLFDMTAMVGAQLRVGSLAGAGTFRLGTGRPVPSPIYVGGSGADSMISGLIEDGTGALSGGQLVKEGAGKLTLSGANTYTEGTLVTGGALFVTNLTGSATGTGSVEVNAGATLGGTGRIAGATIVGGTLTPGGASAGTLTFGADLTLLATSLTQIKIGGAVAGTGYDVVGVSGWLTLDGALTVSLLNAYAPSAGQFFHVLDFGGGSMSGNFSSINLPALGAGLSWDTSALATTGTLGVAASAIPEPSTYAAITGAMALGVAAWRQRGPRRAVAGKVGS